MPQGKTTVRATAAGISGWFTSITPGGAVTAGTAALTALLVTGCGSGGGVLPNSSGAATSALFSMRSGQKQKPNPSQVQLEGARASISLVSPLPISRVVEQPAASIPNDDGAELSRAMDATTARGEHYGFTANGPRGPIQVDVRYANADQANVPGRQDPEDFLRRRLNELALFYEKPRGRLVRVLEMEDQQVPIYALAGAGADHLFLASVENMDGSAVAIAVREKKRGAYERDDLADYLEGLLRTLSVEPNPVTPLGTWKTGRELPAHLM